MRFDLAHVWQAFNFLSRRRQIGFAPSPIQLAEINEYLSIFQFTDLDERHQLVHFIDVLDDVWLRWMRNEIDKNGNSNHSN